MPLAEKTCKSYQRVGGAMTDEEICTQLYFDLCDASIRKDADEISAVLADD